jgi:phosphoribosyl 1,2-cyclic phosphodiesterase
MDRLGLSMSSVKAIFVSHEHSDHITGLPGLSKKYQLPVYITNNTLKDCPVPIDDHLVRPLETGTTTIIGDLSVYAFRKSHDAADPHSFTVTNNQVKIGIFTDIGHSCEQVVGQFRQCHAAFLEANYCKDMLEKGSYPYHLKKRISSNIGHLSNTQALDLFINHRGQYLSHLVLSHLSKNNNSPELVSKLFSEYAGGTQIIVASRYRETEVYQVEGNSIIEAPANVKPLPPESRQLSLF